MKSYPYPAWKFHSILLLTVIILVFLFTAGSLSAHAQYESFSVHIAHPYEGETLYAGPSSWIYRVPVSGWVVHDQPDPSQINIHLEIFKGSQIIGEERQVLHPEGTFSFSVTVNPQGSRGTFTATQEWCTTSCHSPGSLSLQPGELILRVTATTPTGDQATTQHRIFVEHSDYAILPVQVLKSDGSGEGLEGIRVSASTWLYLWRARSASGLTDENGLVELEVEALSSESTTYTIFVEPSTIDGVLYTGGKTVEVSIPPGSKTVAVLSIEISSSTGQLSGSLLGIDTPLEAPISIAAIQLPHGDVFRTDTDLEGTFTISNLPISQYLVTVEEAQLNGSILRSSTQEADLRLASIGSVYIPTRMTKGRSIQGNLSDENDQPVPFAWISVEGTSDILKVFPKEGGINLDGISVEAERIRIDAPGFYSQYQNLEPGSDSISNLNLSLKSQAEILHTSWGDGLVTIPPETNANVDGSLINLQQGWIWGENSTGGHLRIRTPKADISLFQADFAVEYLHDLSAWLFIFSGEADVLSSTGSQSIIVQGGQMVNLLSRKGFKPVPIDTIVLRKMNSGSSSAISSVWEPTSGEQFESWVKEASVRAVQVLTFAVYAIILISIIVVPVITLISWWRSRTSKTSS